MIHQSNYKTKSKLSCFLILFSLIVSFSSCIATKKVVYVEKSANDNSTQTYSPQSWKHKIEVGDRFYINVTDPLSEVSLGINAVNPSTKMGQQSNIILQSPSIQDYLVKENGKIDIPLLGEIEAEGKTISELTTFIKESCKGYISNPSVKLFMTNYNVTVLGEVFRPDMFQLVTQNPNFFDAIGLAGDMTDFANRKRVKIIRKVGDKVEIAYVDITDPNFISSPYFFLHPNDIIHIMPLKVKKFSSDSGLPILLSSIVTLVTLITILGTK